MSDLKNAKVICLLVGLGLSTLTLFANTFQVSNIQDDFGRITGFIDEHGLYNEVADYTAFDPSAMEIATADYDYLVTTQIQKTIDTMTLRSNRRSYDPRNRRINVMEDAERYYLDDGSSWASGAGSFSISSAEIDRVETEGSGLRIYLKNPSDWRRTDYNAGNHSAQGTLRPLEPLVIEAEIGSQTAVLTAEVELISNDITHYGDSRFNFFSSPVGAVLPLNITYRLHNGTFHEDIFNSSFQYYCPGEVDFANPVSVPLPESLVIKGSPRILKNSAAQYIAVVTFDNGTSRNVTQKTVWQVRPSNFASVNGGIVSTNLISNESEAIFVSASYTYGGITVDDEFEILCVSEHDIYPDDAWPMFQGNKEHTGYVPVSLNPDYFEKKWEISLGSNLNPVTAADGKVFVSVPSKFNFEQLFVLDDRDGEQIWSRNIAAISSVGPPSYAYGNVYIQTGKEISGGQPPLVSAFDAKTGAEIFKATFSSQWSNFYAPTIHAGTVYVNGGYYGGMYAFDAFDGTQEWFCTLAQYDLWTPAVDEKYTYAYVGGKLSIIDRITGDTISTINDPEFSWRGWRMQSAPVIGGTDNILVGQNGRLICFDLSNMNIRYSIDGNFTNQPSVADEIVYTINGGILDVRDELTGQQLWTWSPPAGQLENTLIVTDTHVLASTSNEIYVVELLSQTLEWFYPAGGHLALGNNTLYIAGASGTLTAISIPEYIPAEPVSLYIEGPDEFYENSVETYRAHVTYSDGRQRDRTDLVTWSVSESSLEIKNGSLEIGELLYPTMLITLTAEYTEDAKTVMDTKQITVRISCTIQDLLTRNLSKTIQLKHNALADIEHAFTYELASLDIVNALKMSDKGPIARPKLNKARKNIHLALRLEENVIRTIYQSIEELLEAIVLFEDLVTDQEYRDLLYNLKPNVRISADLNDDGNIDMLDFAIFAEQWQNKKETD